MPAIDGRDFIRFAKADPHIAMVPIIVVSGHSDCGGIEGVFAALQKPYSPMELVSLIAAGLESRALQQS
jgi:CheY-like chemotaxis protein